jgi:2-succinyl-6-hydroxy-2,4-cyclohexadiene-1-carboxylate synthase
MTVLLHGFWGQPKDWNAVIAGLPLSEVVWAPDLYEAGPLSPDHTLKAWTDSFLQQVRSSGEGPVQIVGYSMGGRLALNALARAPQMFSRALILSASPFLIDGAEERASWETQWANRFLLEDWTQLEAAWQDLSVFKGSAQAAERRHSQTLREMLGLSLSNWSPRHHAFGTEDIQQLPATVEWAFGALDQKYVKLAKTLQELPIKGQITVIPNAGHRLTAEAAGFICDWIERG